MNIGIDESNTKGYPMIFVGSYSKDPEHVQEGRFTKRRTNSFELNPNTPSFHLPFSLSDRDSFSRDQFQIVATCEIARTIDRLSPVETIYLDGDITDEKRAVLERLLYYRVNPHITLIAEPRLDERMLLVNEADYRANQLFRAHTTKRPTWMDGPRQAWTDGPTSLERTLRIRDYRKYLSD